MADCGKIPFSLLLLRATVFAAGAFVAAVDLWSVPAGDAGVTVSVSASGRLQRESEVAQSTVL